MNNLENRLKWCISEFEDNFELKDYILNKIRDVEYMSIDPDSPYGYKFYMEQEFDCNCVVEHEKYLKSLLRSINFLKEKLKEKRDLEKALEEFDNIDIVKTGRQVAIDNIKKQIVLIELFDQDEVLIDEYERMFGLNLNIMTEEEINKIDLTVFTDCQPR